MVCGVTVFFAVAFVMSVVVIGCRAANSVVVDIVVDSVFVVFCSNVRVETSEK